MEVQPESQAITNNTDHIAPSGGFPLGATVRLARPSDINAVLALHQQAFADKFGGAFGVNGVERGVAAMAAAWQRQGARALRGMYVVDWQSQIIGTSTLRTAEMGSDDSGAVEVAFHQVLGSWGALRSLFVLSLLDHRIGRYEGFITDVAVLEAFRRRGIAQTLLIHIEAEAALRRKHYLGLYVSSANTAARSLYRLLGYRDVRVRHSWLTQLVFGQRSWVYMRKDLE